MNLLIVEDEKYVRSFLKQAFKEEGFNVDVAEDGLIGLRKALTHDYDLILLDLNLPHRNGKEICADLRASGRSTRIMILSVAHEVPGKVELLNIGADAYMIKPFIFGELLAHVRAILRRPDKSENPVLEINGLSLDTARHIAKLRGKDLDLTPKEFLFLEYLMRNRGKILTRVNILENVWGANADPFTNTVDTHILNLRKKLGDTKKKSFIHTISGVGYKML